MKFISTILFLCISVVFSQAIDTDNSKTVYQKLLEYKKSGKHFELLLINQQLIYVSEITELDASIVKVNCIVDLRLGVSYNIGQAQFSPFTEVSGSPTPALIRAYNISDINKLVPIPKSNVFRQLLFIIASSALVGGILLNFF